MSWTNELVDQYKRMIFDRHGIDLSDTTARIELLAGARLYSYKCDTGDAEPLFGDKDMEKVLSNPCIFDSHGELPPYAIPPDGRDLRIGRQDGTVLAMIGRCGDDFEI